MGPRTSGNGRLRESGDSNISGMTHTEESPSSSNTQTLSDISQASGKGVVLDGDSRWQGGEVGLRDDMGEVDQVFNSDRCNIIVVCVIICNFR